MTSDDIVRSWKNEDYRLSLSLDEQALLPDNPAGLIELTDADLFGIAGGTADVSLFCPVTEVFCPLSGILQSLTMSIQLSILRVCAGG